MNTAKLVRWGNSVGIRLSVRDMKLANAYIGEEFTLTANDDGGFTLTPIQNPQKGWLEAFNAAAEKNQDELLLSHIENDFDKDEWQW
jgi:antitoxin component of MazEF toxin-antitoxin module